MDAIETLFTRLRDDPALASRYRLSLSDSAAIEALLSEIDLGVRLEDLRERLRHDAETMSDEDLDAVAGGVLGGVYEFFALALAQVLDIDLHQLIDDIGRKIGPDEGRFAQTR